MIRARAMLAIALTSFAVVLTAGQPAGAAPPDPVDPGDGKEWRQLYETAGVSWNQVAEICPRDGETPCSGTIGAKNFTGWVWATDEQVVDLLGHSSPPS